MTGPQRAAALLIGKRSRAAGLRAWPLPPWMLDCICAKDVTGGDVVCLMPTKDHPNQITAHTAAAIMFEIVSLIADGFGG